MVQSPPLEAGLSRRAFPSGGAALSLGGCAGIRDDYADLPAVVDLCLRRGFSPVETAKLIGGNYVRVFRPVAAARKEAA